MPQNERPTKRNNTGSSHSRLRRTRFSEKRLNEDLILMRSPYLSPQDLSPKTPSSPYLCYKSGHATALSSTTLFLLSSTRKSLFQTAKVYYHNFWCWFNNRPIQNTFIASAQAGFIWPRKNVRRLDALLHQPRQKGIYLYSTTAHGTMRLTWHCPRALREHLCG